MGYPVVYVSKIQVHLVDLEQLHGFILARLQEKKKTPILNVNVHAINLAQRDVTFKEILNSAPMVFCDGAGVALAIQWLYGKEIKRITYADWIYALCAFCVHHNISLFFLGNANGVAEKAAEQLQTRFPGLQIKGTHHGYFKKEGEENTKIISLINDLCPDILLVGFGMPEQEKWILSNMGRLKAIIYLSSGACLDFVAGKVPRGPRWMLDHGFEWLFRFWIEPKRLWKRYLLGNAAFLCRVFLDKIGGLHLRDTNRI
jgi:N-acetylglucosaminyldiphosphoundecaprenol N-acetyl-beta-D-mannosaminyltransferase